MTLGKSAAFQVNTHDSQSRSELPEGWAHTNVGGILAVNYGKGLKKAKRMPGPVPVYGSNGVVGKHNIPLTHGPTIVLGRKGTVGAVHFSKVPCWPIDTTYFIDEFNGLAPRYLVYALRRLNLPQLDTSTAIPGLNRDELYGQYVPLAPVAEQKRIVAKVEQLLARVNVARERLAKVPEILKRFRQSVLAAACSGRLTLDWRGQNPNVEPASQSLRTILAERRARWETAELLKMKKRGTVPRGDKWKQKYKGPLQPSIHDLPDLDERWTWATIDQVTAHEPNAITDGPFGSNLKTAHYTESGPRVIRLQNVGDGAFVDERAHISAEHFEKLLKHRVFPGDVVIATLGDPIPRACTLPANVGPAIVKADCIRLKPHPDLALRRYLTYVLNDQSTRIRMAEGIHGVGRARLNLTEVKAIPVPLPPLTEQKQIVSRVESLFRIAATIEKRVAGATAKAEKLTQAILAKAFRGQLVLTEAELARLEGRSYEPASARLSRIEALRKDIKPQRKRGRSRQRSNK